MWTESLHYSSCSIQPEQPSMHAGFSGGAAHGHLFRTIPPERVGLYGEYDHNGLTKRVEVAFQQQFNVAEIAHLTISQRGAIVILEGNLTHQQVLRLVAVALSVEGAIGVEFNGATVV